MNTLAYRQGQKDAFAKFGGASAAGPDGVGSSVATTTHRDSMQNISQGFAANAAKGQTSSFTDPGILNATMQGGTPTKRFTSDTSGGLRDS